MKTSILFALAIARVAAVHALDLTPIDSFRLLEGAKIPVVVFDDGKRDVNWQPPAGWQLSGADNQLDIYPLQANLAGMRLRIISRKAAQVPDPTSAPDAFLKWALGFLPADTTSLTFDHQTPSPFLLDELHSRELTLKYVSSTRKTTTSIALVDLDETHSLAVVISARAEDFQPIHDAGIQSMFRWSWVKKPLPGQGATAAK